ncbi:nucleolar protein dao-5-like [Salvia hispanica]|uniref:nucleolar protein dao-5-like n=1 Tax=Salvia hispanica TaxID=49212 RepID=UPI0020098D11|nr:nucleolar protein dao-5-like [Salvia hispanica]
MTKPDGLAPETTNDDVSPAAWGTWEELLLAFAVNRHGTAAWDSIASELQKRTSDPNLCLTAHNCRSRYLDLKRRFVVTNGDLEGEDKSNVEESAPLLEELRKLRVAELRREVQRYDLNIESLELKMKRMEEEREKGVRREESEADLEDNAKERRDCEPVAAPPAGGEPAVIGESEKDRLSVNESNSTDPGAEKLRAGEEACEPARTGGDEERNDRTGQTSGEPAETKPEPDHKSVREDSCNGSSNSIDEPDRKAKAEPVARSTESEGESDGGGAGAMKENSDVQSSASRSRKEEGSDKVRRGSMSGDEREHEDQSRAVKELSAESQPLVDFLQAIRAPKIGSIFQRRLRSQETPKYQKLIHQHMDLETIETRLKEGFYTRSRTKFYRDLLLLVNNALVFFSKNSSEATAALEIRRLISKEFSPKHAKSDSSSGKQASLQSLSMPKKDDAEASPSPSLMLKQRLSGSLIVCRKRSSITKATATASSSGTDKKKELVQSPAEDKDAKQQRSGDAEEPKITKKRTRDRFPAASSANSKKNGKSQANANVSKTSPAETVKQGKGGGSSSSQAEAKGDAKKTQSTSDSKKRGAAGFLSRMKQGSPSSNNGVLLDALKNTPLTSESATGKKSETAKRGEKKEPAATRRGAETRQTKEKSSPGKRNVGRPPKRAAAAAPPAAGKRSRDRGDPEPAAASKQPKKRARKL